MNIRYTQDQLKELLANSHKLTEDTSLFEGMHIYTILKAKENGCITKKGYNLIIDEVVLTPNNKDWEEWEKYPENSNKNRFDLDQDNYWVLADADNLAKRTVMSTQEILNMELAQKKNNIFVNYSN
ncbi:hypothetical protein MU859_06350 [Lactobacillus kefiranofaciens subsp. kefirgranum]|uniref:hypothetical protein n=1 Tax=Lactobacillus kefiranofaciens TaxID=267818 RepID=UPI0006D059F4|nr:hypothetical protein [Lactobacillus kefiranofaciens]MCP9331481.1 hypothetical protein [Lactobacillus kefiranofaciens]PAK97764.1 hypothetical protein B8W86_08255 [Lactobacillus kefiranofaciens]URW70613.1 hypothetical protein MU859_06350 [Lactobacillus kefiranofaciens subsp. kefirgranum]URW72555.1 hypothetical protein MU860_06235 [Lactobacillus kefiranofaciens subsp. kefirgranum]